MICVVNTEPIAKGRPRFVKRGKFVQTYTPKKTLDYETIIKKEFIKQCEGEYNSEYTGAIDVRITFFFAPPKSISKKKKEQLIGTPHLKKPDTDNLAKAILDALNGTAWKDDSQIFLLTIEKQYNENNQVFIKINYKEGE